MANSKCPLPNEGICLFYSHHDASQPAELKQTVQTSSRSHPTAPAVPLVLYVTGGLHPGRNLGAPHDPGWYLDCLDRYLSGRRIHGCRNRDSGYGPTFRAEDNESQPFAVQIKQVIEPQGFDISTAAPVSCLEPLPVSSNPSTTMVSTSAIRDWQWPGPENFLCSSNPALLQRDAISAALDSELLWWAKPLDETSLDKMLRNSLCLAVYHMQQTESRDGEGERGRRIPCVVPR